MAICTVAIPVYNREELVRGALESALSQDVAGLEILVVDNCSTDATWSVLNSYSDARIRLMRNSSNVGLFGNFNRCLDLARGKYLRYLCSDDRLTSNCLIREIETMEQHPNVALLSTRGRRIDQTGRFLGAYADHFRQGIYPGAHAIHAVLWFQAHYAYNPLNYPSGILLRREAALQTGQFETRMRMLGDVDFFLRMLEYGDLAVLDALGCDIGIHEQQEGVHLTGEIATMQELYLLAARYQSLFEKAGTSERVRQQLAAYALGLAFKYWRMGLPESSRVHRQLAFASGVSKIQIAGGVLRLLGLRLLLQTIGLRLIDARPSTQLGGFCVD